MHVLIIPGEGLNESNTLSSIFELNQARALTKADITVGFISYRCVGGIRQFLSKIKLNLRLISIWQLFSVTETRSVKVQGFNLIEANFFDLSHGIKKLKYFYLKKAGLCAFETYTRLHGCPDIIHAHSRFLEGALIAYYIKQNYNLKYVLTEHSSFYSRNLVKREEHVLVKKIINNSDYWIVVSKSLGDMITRLYENNLNKSYNCLPNVIDSTFNNFKKSYQNASQKFQFISIASLDPNKNQELIIDAFTLALKENPNFTLKFIGEGEDYKKVLFDKIKINQIGKYVTFVDNLDVHQIKLSLEESQVLIVSSKNETFGVVIIEALATGTPVISTMCGGPESIINENNGILVKNQDISEMATAMKNIYQNFSKFCPLELHNDCILKYGDKTFSKNLKNIYISVLEND